MKYPKNLKVDGKLFLVNIAVTGTGRENSDKKTLNADHTNTRRQRLKKTIVNHKIEII